VADPDLADLERRMEGAIDVLRTEFAGLRTGRASTSLLEPIVVEAYGSQMPMNQVGTIAVPEARMLTVQVWDQGLVRVVDKAIRESGLGLNPQIEGQVLRIPIPELNEERRQDLTKIANKYAEQARISIRNVRRDGMDKLKRMEKEHEISEDEHRAWSADIQVTTDKCIKHVDDAFDAKEQEILQV
jgi:ribosome recycling factor